jgi:hypothetical protein
VIPISTRCTKEKHQSLTKERKLPKKEKMERVLLANVQTREKEATNHDNQKLTYFAFGHHKKLDYI